MDVVTSVFHRDILLMVLNAIDNQHTTSSLMRTCHFLYSAGLPKLLAFPIQLGRYGGPGGAGFSAFSDFVLDDVHSRAGHLREMHIFSTKHLTDEDVRNKFVSVMLYAKNLRKFSMGCEQHPAEPLIVAALANNQTITRLSLQSPDFPTVTTF